MSNHTGYILGPLIARGGMAEIFLGKVVGDDGFGRLCAIKRILPHHANDKDFVRMFRDEAHICKRLQHANIVQVYDFQEIDGSYAIVMEFIDGSDLRSLLAACEKANNRLTIPMAVFIAAQAARGLHYAHTKIDEITHQPLGIVHRDVSPQNILVSYEGEVKVTDFGIADADDKVSETLPGTVKGKYSYMSPEQIAVKDLDARSDIFSLAIVLWEMLGMRRLFAGKNEIETIKKVQAAEIRYKLTDLNPKVDNDLFAIVNKGLAKERRHRYQTAAHFEKDLLRYLHSQFPDFTASELGSFLKKLMAKQRGESARDIKKTLTSTNLKGQISKSSSKLMSSDKDVEQSPDKDRHQDEAIVGRKSGRHDNIANSLPDPPPVSEVERPFSIALDSISSKSQMGKVAISLDEDDQSSIQLGLDSSYGVAQKTGFTGVDNHFSRSPRDDEASRLRYSILRSKNLRHRSRSKTNILSVAGLVLAVALVWFGLRFESTPRLAENPGRPDAMTLGVTTVPSFVQLELNGQPLYNNRFVRTPIELRNIPAGQHALLIKRPGYRSLRLNFQGRPGVALNEDRLVMERDPQFRRAPTTVHLRGIEQADFIVNDGFHRGTLQRSSPMAFDDLAFGRQHVIAIRVSNSDPVQCRFVPRSETFSRPFEVHIDYRQGRIYCSVRSP